MFMTLFPQQPEFQGRSVVTFHNQRDFIFVRRHRYIFRDRKRVGLQEIGPRFTVSWAHGKKKGHDLRTAPWWCGVVRQGGEMEVGAASVVVLEGEDGPVMRSTAMVAL